MVKLGQVDLIDGLRIEKWITLFNWRLTYSEHVFYQSHQNVFGFHFYNPKIFYLTKKIQVVFFSVKVDHKTDFVGHGHVSVI